MGSARNVKDIRSYCDVMFDELTDMKSRLLSLADTVDQMEGSNEELVGLSDHGPHDHRSHLCDIAKMIDWKLEILTKVCPSDWMKYAAGAEQVSVKAPEKSGKFEFDADKSKFDKEFASPGDLGG